MKYIITVLGSIFLGFIAGRLFGGISVAWLVIGMVWGMIIGELK